MTNSISQNHHVPLPGTSAYSAPFGNDAHVEIFPQWRATVIAAPFQPQALPHAPLPNSIQAVVRHLSRPQIPLSFQERKVTFQFCDRPRFNLHDFQVNVPAEAGILEITQAQPTIRPSNPQETWLLKAALDAMSHTTINAQWSDTLSFWNFSAKVYVPDGHHAHPSSQPNNYSVNLFIDRQRNAHICEIRSIAANLATTYFLTHSTDPRAMTHTMSVAPSTARVNDDLTEQVPNNWIHHPDRDSISSEYTLANLWFRNAQDFSSRKCHVSLGMVRMLANDGSTSCQTPGVIRTQANVATRNPSGEEHELLGLVLNDMSKRKVVAQSDDASGNLHVISVVHIAQLQSTYVVNLFIESPNMESVYVCHIRSIATGLTNNYVLDDYAGEDTVNAAMQTAARVKDGVIALLEEEPNKPPQEAIWDACAPTKRSSAEASGTSAGATHVHDFPSRETSTANASERQAEQSNSLSRQRTSSRQGTVSYNEKKNTWIASHGSNAARKTYHFSVNMHGYAEAKVKAKEALKRMQAEKVNNLGS